MCDTPNQSPVYYKINHIIYIVHTTSADSHFAKPVYANFHRQELLVLNRHAAPGTADFSSVQTLCIAWTSRKVVWNYYRPAEREYAPPTSKSEDA